MRSLLSFLALCLFATTAFAAEKGIFDYEGQKAAGEKVKKIIFIADAGTHGPRGNHEFMAASILFARTLNEVYPDVHAVVHSTRNWPTDVAHADAFVVSLNHGQKAATDPNIAAAVRKGAGFMAIHFGVEVNKGDAGDNYTRWMGGYFETFWSVNPWWTPEFKEIPEHALTRGVKPFSVKDEWYYHMRYKDGMAGVTPILSAVAPLSTVRKEPSDRGGNAAVFEEVSAGKPQVMAWAYEREDGGRGFGFTGMHNHSNLGDNNFRTLLLNGCAWVTKLEIPKDGVPSQPLDKDALEKLIDEAQKAIAEKK
ncbi:ThuA domain-containing protein [Anatilimnocola floriformis]|uniref:ThuA domain-containing protein n=1 Tax=Anatilimnocola floriformis TaxID=2948575 RepID=UPI0020C31223|nr:ThuA domain-containing protein [Anatilimnocola floriformis]